MSDDQFATLQKQTSRTTITNTEHTRIAGRGTLLSGGFCMQRPEASRNRPANTSQGLHPGEEQPQSNVTAVARAMNRNSPGVGAKVHHQFGIIKRQFVFWNVIYQRC
jgi:hypothetical protein